MQTIIAVLILALGILLLTRLCVVEWRENKAIEARADSRSR